MRMCTIWINVKTSTRDYSSSLIRLKLIFMAVLEWALTLVSVPTKMARCHSDIKGRRPDVALTCLQFFIILLSNRHGTGLSQQPLHGPFYNQWASSLFHGFCSFAVIWLPPASSSSGSLSFNTMDGWRRRLVNLLSMEGSQFLSLYASSSSSPKLILLAGNSPTAKFETLFWASACVKKSAYIEACFCVFLCVKAPVRV